MDTMDLLEAMGPIRDKYILRAGEVRRKKPARRIPYALAAMLALALLCAALAQTPMGTAAVETVKEAVSRVIDRLFPPKELIVMPEGTPEAIHHEAQGRDPEEEYPGFAMYVDTQSYVMTEENGTYYIRQIPIEYDREEIADQQAALLEGLSPEEQEAAIDARIQELEDFYASLPVNEIEIREIPDKEFSAYAEAVKNHLSTNWETIGDIIRVEKPLALAFTVSSGNAWDSPQEVHYFVDNGKQGTFHIVARYYLEAAEGHGVRFASMIQTFTVVTDSEYGSEG